MLQRERRNKMLYRDNDKKKENRTEKRMRACSRKGATYLSDASTSVRI